MLPGTTLLKIRNYTQQFITILLLIGSVAAYGITVENPRIILAGDTPIHLSGKLQPAAPPSTILRSSTTDTYPGDSQWYKLTIQRSPYALPDWKLAFRAVPYQLLDIFIPSENGYQQIKLGMDRDSDSINRLSIPIELKPEETQAWYLRYHSAPPNQLTPIIWPGNSFEQQYNSQENLASALQILLLVSALFVLTLSFRQKTKIAYLFIAHILAANGLLLMCRGDIFRTLPWPGDPGHWIIITLSLVIISGMSCYRHLSSINTYAPIVDKIIMGSSTLALALVVYYLSSPVTLPPAVLESAVHTLFVGYILVILGTLHCWYNRIRTAQLALISLITMSGVLSISWQLEPWPRSLPSLLEITAITLHSAVLCVLYWYSYHHNLLHTQSFNVVNNPDQKRRIYESALRQHLQNPKTPLSENEIPTQTLATIEKALPEIPAMILVYEKDLWDIQGEYSLAAENLRDQLKTVGNDLLQVVNNNIENRINFKDRFGRHYWVFPLNISAEKTIMLTLAPSRNQRNAIDWQTAGDISSHARTLIQASQQSRSWQQQACLDSLTSLLNRRGFQQEATPVIRDALSNDEIRPCSLLFMDVDHFKKINDHFGHAAGDQTLKNIASILRNALRHKDLLARYGGEEFVALLPNTEPWQALQVAERIRNQIEAAMCLPDGSLVTMSIGLSALTPQTTNLDKLIRDADDAMYRAKEKGRNQTAISRQLNDSRLPA